MYRVSLSIAADSIDAFSVGARETWQAAWREDGNPVRVSAGGAQQSLPLRNISRRFHQHSGVHTTQALHSLLCLSVAYSTSFLLAPGPTLGSRKESSGRGRPLPRTRLEQLRANNISLFRQLTPSLLFPI